MLLSILLVVFCLAYLVVVVVLFVCFACFFWLVVLLATCSSFNKREGNSLVIIIIMGLESVSASEDVIGDLPSP